MRAATAEGAPPPPARLGRRRPGGGGGGALVAVDGANVMFGYGKAAGGPLVPRSRGLELCLRHLLAPDGGAADAVAFVPADLIEGPLWRVADGRISVRSPVIDELELVEEDVFGAPDGAEPGGEGGPGGSEGAWMAVEGARHLWRNRALSDLRDRGAVRVVKDHIRVSRYHLRGFPVYDDDARVVTYAPEIPSRPPSKVR